MSTYNLRNKPAALDTIEVQDPSGRQRSSPPTNTNNTTGATINTINTVVTATPSSSARSTPPTANSSANTPRNNDPMARISPSPNHHPPLAMEQRLILLEQNVVKVTKQLDTLTQTLTALAANFPSNPSTTPASTTAVSSSAPGNTSSSTQRSNQPPAPATATPTAPTIQEVAPAPLNIPQPASATPPIPQPLPRFRGEHGIKDFDRFLELFTNLMIAHQYPKDRWKYPLLLTLSNTDATWFKEHIIPSSDPWDAIADQCRERFRSPLHSLHLQEAFFKIRTRPNESLEAFGNRFVESMRRLQLDSNSTTYTALLINALPPDVCSQLKLVAMSNPNLTVDQAVALLPSIELPSAKFFCSYHGKGNHSTSQCRALARSASPSSTPSSSAAPTATPATRQILTCHICRSPSHLANKCPQRAAKPTPPSPSASPKVSLHLLETAPPPISIAISIAGHMCSATIDTGASHSFIDKSLYAQWQLHYEQQPIPVSLGDRHFPSTAAGVTPHLTVVREPYCIEHAFLLMDLPDNHQTILGRDILPSLGIGLSIPPPFLPTTTDPPTTEPQQSTTATQDAFWLDTLSPELRRFDSLDGSFCNHPLATVYLDTGDDPPINRRQYRIPHAHHPAVTATVQEWLASGIISPAPPGCLWNQPILAVPKANGGTRVCLDPRPLNNILRNGDNFPLPLIQDIFEHVSTATIFSRLDLKSGYNQLPIYGPDRVKTAFTWNNTQYIFNGVPFGLKHVGSVFQRLMSAIFSALPFVLVYIDDIVIFSANQEDHLTHLRTVLGTLADYRLRINLEKCAFGRSELPLLGHVIGHRTIRAIPPSLNIALPTSGRQIESLLGLTNYFRCFIPQYSSIAAPLESLRKQSSFTLNEEQRQAVHRLLEAIRHAPILHPPDFSVPFYVATDASSSGIGAVLYQHVGDKTQHVTFISRALTPTERRYSTTKRELLAIVWSLQKLRYYLFGRRFHLLTDHKPLEAFWSQPHLHATQERWLDTIAEYDFDITYLPGALNTLADHLSRLHSSEPLDHSLLVLEPSDPPPHPPGTVDLQQEPSAPEPSQATDQPPPDRGRLIAATHALGHFGARSMVNRLRSLGHDWPGMHQACQQVAASCLPCQRYNIGKHGFHPLASITADNPMDHVAVDLAGPLPVSSAGNTYLLVVTDVFTRFVFLRPLPSKEASSVAKALLPIFCDFGFPKILQSDNGTEFVNHLMAHLLSICGIDHRATSPYHPRANGVAERTVQTSLLAIKKRLLGHASSWDTFVPGVQLAINIHTAARTNSPPFALMFGRAPNSFDDFSATPSPANIDPTHVTAKFELLHSLIYPTIRASVIARTSRRQEVFNRRHRLISFPVGSHVMVVDTTRADKLAPMYEGPYRVARKTRGGSYLLQDLDGHVLQRSFPPSLLKAVPPPSDTDNVFTVERICGHRLRDSTLEYNVKWLGYPASQNTWEPATNFIDLSVLNHYWRSLPTEPSPS
jgi:transposase InsO family protein